MGFISDLSKAAADFKPLAQNGRDAWRRIFGGPEKEIPPAAAPVANGGSYHRSVSSDAAIKRLIQAMRSNAPGGWSDNRLEQENHFVGITYVAIHRQNELLTQAEFQVFERDPNHPDGKRPTRSREGEALIRLLEKPNPDDSFGDLIGQWNLQMELTGSALTWMVPNALGVPFELYPIPTALAIPQPVINAEYPDGYYRIQPVYPYGPFSSAPTPNTAVGAAIPGQWMLKFKYPHPLLRYDGYSPQTAMRLHLDEIESMDRSRWYAMKRNINPSAILSFDNQEGNQPLPDAEIERLVAEFENEHQGPENTGRLFVTSGKLEQFGTSPREMDYQGSWDQLVSFALGAFGVTKPAAGMIDDSSYSTLFATLKQLYWLTLEPKVDRIAKKLTRKLACHFGDDLIVEVRCKRIDDHELTFSRIDKGLQGKCIKKNELRKLIDLPTTMEPWGDQIAGTDDPQTILQQTMAATPGMPPPVGMDPAAGMGDPMADPMAAVPPGMDPALMGVPPDEAQRVESSRPTPGNLSDGSLGPREKSLEAAFEKLKKKKSLTFYDRVQKAITNGNGTGH